MQNLKANYNDVIVKWVIEHRGIEGNEIPTRFGKESRRPRTYF